MLDLENQETEVAAPVEKVGGNSYLKDSNIYPATIKQCWYGEWPSGAAFVEFNFQLKGAGFYTERINISTNKANNQRVTYKDKNTGENHLLPGAATVGGIFYTALHENLSTDATVKDVLLKVLGSNSPGIVKVYDRAVGAMVEREEAVIGAVIDKEVLIAIKSVKQPYSVKIDTGYVDSANETNDENVISMSFSASNQKNSTEMVDDTEALLHDDWLKKWKGEVQVIKPRKTRAGEPVVTVKGKVDNPGVPGSNTATNDDNPFG